MCLLSILFLFLSLSLFPYFITSQLSSLLGSEYSLVNSGTNYWSIQNITHFGNNPDIGVIPGGIVIFHLHQASQHPFGFSTIKGDKNQPTITTKNYQIEADGGCRFYTPAGVPTAAYLPVDTTGTIPCILKWTVPISFQTGNLYYQCHGHPAMTGTFFVQASTSDNSTSGTTTVTTSTTATPTTTTPTTTPTPTPTPNPTTTTPPTNPATTTPPTNPSTTSPPTSSGNVTIPTNDTSSSSSSSSSSISFNTSSSSSSSTAIIGGSSSTAIGGAASNLFPSIGIMYMIVAAHVVATITIPL